MTAIATLIAVKNSHVPKAMRLNMTYDVRAKNRDVLISGTNLPIFYE